MKPLFLGYDARRRPIRLTPDDRRIHMHVIGSSGSGKSKFLEWMIRGDLRNRQGFALLDPHGTLYDDVVSYIARYPSLGRDVILLNLSAGDRVIGFNPFQRASEHSVSVQVSRRIIATMHAWGVENADQTPTLERVLRLIYTVMIERNLGLPQVRHLIDFNARDIRAELVDRLQTELVAAEWREIQALKQREWREETLSARNRLFRLLTSPTLMRFMGVPGRTLDLKAIMDEGKVLLVNLAGSDDFSEEDARVFGALLVNEFFEAARRRRKDTRGRDPRPYYLYMDEFQNFVSLDIADMLDQVRKFGLFTILAHQRFGHLDENITDAVLTNCRIKAVFGGLRVESAELMARELFIGKLDPMRIKVAIEQTKFWPKYKRDKVYAHGTSHTQSSSSSSSTGGGDTSTTGYFDGGSASTGYFYDDWFSTPQLSGTRSETTSRSFGSSTLAGRSSNWLESSADGVSNTDSESVADIPILIPVPFRELSSIEYFPIEEQLLQMTAALKEQFPRHCFIKIQNEDTEPMLVPKVEDVFVSRTNRRWWVNKSLTAFNALPPEEVDALIAAQETALLQAATGIIEGEFEPVAAELLPRPDEEPAIETPLKRPTKKQLVSPWARKLNK